jgi:hypothetical protein
MRFQNLFHSPNRGSFHLSLTVLVHYRCLHVFSLGRWACRVHTGLHVSRATLDKPKEIFGFRIRGYYPLWLSFPAGFSYPKIFLLFYRLDTVVGFPNPLILERKVGIKIALDPNFLSSLEFGLIPFRSPLLREYLF